MIRKFIATLCGVVACATLSITACAQDGTLLQAVADIEARLQARLGVTVIEVGTERIWQYRGDERFPMSSTFKTLACAALLHHVDEGLEDLQRVVTIEEQELVSYSPVTEARTDSTGMTLEELCVATITVSDNTAGNKVLQAIGGPAGLTAFMRTLGDQETRLDRWETDLNEGLPGDRRDTTTPHAMARAVQQLVLGQVLSATSRQLLEDWLRDDKVADALFRAGLPGDWEIADKTGAGGHGSRSIAAVMWTPSGNALVATVYITETEASFDARNAAIAQIGTAIADAVITGNMFDD